jgi:hypothetical protein
MKEVAITVTLTDLEARQYAQFLKRVCFSHYRESAANDGEAYTMVHAGEKIRDALREMGYAPR